MFSVSLNTHAASLRLAGGMWFRAASVIWASLQV